MTPRERFIQALRREKVEGLVPHFELVFFLTMEAVGRVHPLHRSYTQWYQMSRSERKLHLRDMALAYVEIAEKYEHSAIFVHPNPGPFGDLPDDLEATREILEEIRELTGDKYFLMIHGDPTLAIPTGSTMMEFSVNMYEHPERMHEDTKRRMALAQSLVALLGANPGLADGFALCSDYCFNANPFYTNEQFDEFVGPYLKEILDLYRSEGFYSIKHSDGNIMPILEQVVACGPDAVHSLDPQGGVDLAAAKRMVGDRVCLIGNVNCGLMQTGSDEELVADTERSLREGMPGYGYIFSTSNCAYTGLELRRYELMHRVWKEKGVYTG